MILSMTGYGRESVLVNGVIYNVELKALNAKSLDIRAKLPPNFTEREMSMRKLLTDEVIRGRIEFNISSGEDKGIDDFNINTNLLTRYFNQLKNHQEELGISNSDIFSAVMRIPSVTESLAEPISDEDYNKIEQGIKNAIKSLINFRIDEGKVLSEELLQRVNNITNNLELIQPLEEQRINKIKERIRKNFEEFIAIEKIDLNRFEQEILYYVEKIDISEEKLRLRQHCTYFIEQMKAADNPGRILGFIAQEMGREINTLGAKAQDSEIQQLIVVMKDELEKIKEQIANIL
jgi:uncharacterized protein (TIGR00255 family)